MKIPIVFHGVFSSHELTLPESKHTIAAETLSMLARVKILLTIQMGT